MCDRLRKRGAPFSDQGACAPLQRDSKRNEVFATLLNWQPARVPEASGKTRELMLIASEHRSRIQPHQALLKVALPFATRTQ